MNQQEIFQDKKARITAKAENVMMKLRIHNRELLTFMVKNEIHRYHEAKLKGIHVSCEEMERSSKKLENFEKNLRSNEAFDIVRISIKAESDIEVERKKYEERTWTCEDDGRAHLFLYRKRIYYRAFNGAVWKANEGELGAWAGFWNGLYLSKGKRPQPQRPIRCCQ